MEVDFGSSSVEALPAVLLAVDLDHGLVTFISDPHSIEVVSQFRAFIFEILVATGTLLWSGKVSTYRSTFSTARIVVALFFVEPEAAVMLVDHIFVVAEHCLYRNAVSLLLVGCDALADSIHCVLRLSHLAYIVVQLDRLLSCLADLRSFCSQC